MGHPDIECPASWTFELLHVVDEDARPVAVPLCAATFSLATGTPRRLEEARPLEIGGAYAGPPGASSLRREVQIAYAKTGTDVVLLGHARSPRGPAPEVLVSFQCGALSKVVRVVGDRFWFKSLGAFAMTEPTPFEALPLVYERAFGGVDRTVPGPNPALEMRNPLGVGYHAAAGAFREGDRLPNLEHPEFPIRGFRDAPPPAGFGFVDPGWQPRAGLAGTYDAVWRAQRAPAWPKDFDRRFFSAAAPGLASTGHLAGDEAVKLVGATAAGPLAFRLPGRARPTVRLGLRRSPDREIELALDTVILDADALELTLLWRGHLHVADGPHDVTAARVRPPAFA